VCLLWGKKLLYICTYLIGNTLINRMRKKAVLHIVKVESNVLLTINRKKGNWLVKASYELPFKIRF